MDFLEFKILVRLLCHQAANSKDIITRLKAIERKLTKVTSNQDHLSADVAALGAAIAAVEAEIVALKNQPPEALDFTGLDAAVAQLQGDVPAPVEPPPAPPVEPTP